MVDQLGSRTTLTPAECHAILIKASRYDGRSVGPENVKDWHEAAVMQRWTDVKMCMTAVVEFYSRAAKPGDRLWIMPAHVTEFIRAQNRQPAQFERAALTGPPPAGTEARKRAIAAWAQATADRKKVPDSYGEQQSA